MNTFNDTLENLCRFDEFMKESPMTVSRFVRSTQKQFQSSPILGPPKRRRFESEDIISLSDKREDKREIVVPEFNPFCFEDRRFDVEREEDCSANFSFVHEEEEPENYLIKEEIEEELDSLSIKEDNLIKNKINSTQLSIHSTNKAKSPKPEVTTETIKQSPNKAKNASIKAKPLKRESLFSRSSIFEASPFVKTERACQIFFKSQQERLTIKINRTREYWSRESLLIPNIFRFLQKAKDDTDFIQEFQDLSRKEVLVQNNGQKNMPKRTKKIGKKNKVKDIIKTTQARCFD